MNYRTQDAEFCGKVPLHQTNLIQPHGVLVVLKRDDGTIIQVSENCVDVFGATAQEITNKQLSDFITGTQARKFIERIKKEFVEGLPFALTVRDMNFLSLVHVKEDYVIMEIELPVQESERRSFIHMYQELKCVMADVDDAISTGDACSRAIKELKRITGFDKIMIYQFDQNWNGTVIAEEAEEGMERYLGLRFPASDVPKQARDLYLKNPYRLVPDVAYTPVKIYPLLNPISHGFTDLSNTNLRSIAAVHIEYLKNMKVMASMSTRIIQDDKLWGLISCHHRTPKYVSYETCFVFELVSNIMSAKIASVQKADAAAYNAGLLKPYQRILENIFNQDDLFQVLEKNKTDLLDLLKAEGAALVLNKQVKLLGRTPSQAQVQDLVFWLRSQEVKKLYHNPNLTETYEEASEYAAKASGLLALPLQPEKGNYLLAFRPEFVDTIQWGGNPNEAINFEADRKSYHPRNSFRQWQETVNNTALLWQQEELHVAESFRHVLLEFILNKKH